MKRVVVTGMGIVSCMGNSIAEVQHALWHGISGLQIVPRLRELGFQVPVAGLVREVDASMIRKRLLRTMAPGAKYAAVAAYEALQDAGFSGEALRSTRVGIVVGTGGGGFDEAGKAETLLTTYKSPTRLGAVGPMKIMNASATLNLAAWLGVRGRCYSISSACCTGVDCIGHGFELIRRGLLDVCICGATEETSWGVLGFYAAGFGNPKRIRTARFEGQPSMACRPYDRDRLGMMIASEGAGIVVLEALEHAASRGVSWYAELVGYGSANDGSDMFAPNGSGLKQCIQEALEMGSTKGPLRIDYINPHGVGTKVGDPIEVEVIREVFGTPSPLLSSTKPLNGHAQGAAGVHEAIFTLLMLHHGFVAPTANLEHIAPECAGVRHVQSREKCSLETALTFNSGLGGTNACLVFSKL